MWCILRKVEHFFKCGAFYQQLRIFSSLAHFFEVWRIFLGVAQFSNCGASLGHFFTSTGYICVAHIPSLAHIVISGAFMQGCGVLPTRPHFFKCYLVFQVWYIFSSVAHFSKCGAVFQVWRFFPSWHIFPSVEHFSKVAAFYQQNRIFLSVPHFSKCGTILEAWRSFPSVAHFSKFGAFCQT